MHQRALVADPAIAPHEDVIGDGLTEDLDLEDVGDDLLRLSVDIGVDERHVVVGGDDVAEGGEALLNALEGDSGGERVAEVLKLLVGGGGRDEETVSVSWREGGVSEGARRGGTAATACERTRRDQEGARHRG